MKTPMKTLLIDLFLFLIRNEVKTMAVVYATLIVKKMKTFNQVPPTLKEQVREILITLECPELAE